MNNPKELMLAWRKLCEHGFVAAVRRGSDIALISAIDNKDLAELIRAPIRPVLRVYGYGSCSLESTEYAAMKQYAQEKIDKQLGDEANQQMERVYSLIGKPTGA